MPDAGAASGAGADLLPPAFVMQSASGIAWESAWPGRSAYYLALLVMRFGNTYAASLPVAVVSSYLGEKPWLEVAGTQVKAVRFGKRKPVTATENGFNAISPKHNAVMVWSASKILNGRASPPDLTGKIVLVGPTRTMGPRDDATAPLVMLDALVADGLLNGTLLIDPTTTELSVLFLVTTIISFVALWYAARFRPVALTTTFVLNGAFVIGVTALWELCDETWRNEAFVWSAVWLVLAFSGLPAFGILFWRSVADRRRLRSAFRHYVDPKVIEAVLRDPDGLRIGGAVRRVTVLFADIVDFTNTTERTPPDQMIAMLNTYMEAMTDVVMRTGGIVDKIIGDSIMAFWGAPIPQPDSAQRAVECALSILDELERLKERDMRFANVSIGVGVATGDAVVGNLGGQKRFDYSLIGDTVNLASRLESLTRQLNVRILVDQETFAGKTAELVARDLGQLRVKGKQQAVRVWEIGWPQLHSSFFQAFNSAVAEIVAGSFQVARNKLDSLRSEKPDDVATQMYFDRLSEDREPEPEGIVLEFRVK